MTKILYFDDPMLLDFPAEVEESFPLPDGRVGVVLAATCFYPTSGGQEHDKGFIGEAVVLDVFKEDDGRIVHVLDRKLAPGTYPGKVDRNHRQRAMQHHTGQHILSAAFLGLLGIESVSANINADTPSTIDLDVDGINKQDLARVETAVNQVIFENRMVKTYFITEADLSSIPFRKPPKVSGNIRVVEVDGYDYTPCGGTHCLRTGSIGIIKILRTERINRKLRIHFLAGFQALDVLGSYSESIQKTAGLLNTRTEELPQSVQKLIDQTLALQSQVSLLREQAIDTEARTLVLKAEPVENVNLVVRHFHDRSAAELRSLAIKIAGYEDLVAVLASHNGEKVSVVAAAHSGCHLDARKILAEVLLPAGGRGGGDAFVSQGGGTAPESTLDDLARRVKAWIISKY